MKRQFTAPRLIGLGILFAGMFAFIAYMAVNYPTEGSTAPSRSEWSRYIPQAIISIAIVIIVDALTIVAIRRRQKRLSTSEKDPLGPKPSSVSADAAPVSLNPIMQAAIDRALTQEKKRERKRFDVPNALELQSVPLNIVLISMACSGFLLVGSIYYGFPLWGIVLAAMVPWMPVVTFEASWKYQHYGFYAVMLVFTVLQIGHLGEHSVQVLQLLLTGGDITAAHGVFGALDRELVHFTWDSLVWIGVCVLLIRLGPHNRWLWIAFVAASFHEVEHIFLFYLDRFQTAFYEAGGTTGIFAKGGLIGSPLHRPYLHYVYNFFVVIPLIMALWDETKRAFNVFLAKALPSLTEEEKVQTSGQLERRHFDAGETIVQEGQASDHFYIVAEGECEVLRDGPDQQPIRTLGPGDFFGELGLLLGGPRTATVKARTDVEVLALDRNEFSDLIARSARGATDVNSALGTRLGELKARSKAAAVQD